MSIENRKYVIIPLVEVEDVDFSQVLQDSAETLRLSQDGEYTFVKFEGDTPSFLNGKTEYNHSQILSILKDSSGIWCISDLQAYLDNLNDYQNNGSITIALFNENGTQMGDDGDLLFAYVDAAWFSLRFGSVRFGAARFV